MASLPKAFLVPVSLRFLSTLAVYIDNDPQRRELVDAVPDIGAHQARAQEVLLGALSRVVFEDTKLSALGVRSETDRTGTSISEYFQSLARKFAERAPLNLALIIDRSGSMQGDKLRYVQQAARHVLDLLGEQDRVAVVAYDDQVNLIVPKEVYERHRAVVRSEPLVLARGRFERVERNRNVLVSELESLSPLARRVAETQEVVAALPRAHHFGHR